MGRFVFEEDKPKETAARFVIEPDSDAPTPTDIVGTEAPTKLWIDHDGEATRVMPKDGATESLIKEPILGKPSFSLLETVKNIPQSSRKMIEDTASTVLHPIDTIKGVASLAEGATVGKLLDHMGMPEQAQEHNVDSANAVWGALSDRYGGVDNILSTLQNDPVGFAADLSTVLTGAGGAAKLAGTLGKVAKVADVGSAVMKAGAAVDPVNVAGKVASLPGKIPKVKDFPAQLLGVTTGAGPEAIKSAMQGGDEFKNAMRGNTTQDEIVTNVRDAVSEVRNKRGEAYRTALEQLEKNSQVIPLDGIEKTFNDALTTFRVKRDPQTGALSNKGSAVNGKDLFQLEEMQSIIKEWKSDPTLHNAAGLDTLKRRLDDFYSDSSNVRALITKVRNDVKKTIVDAVPEYSKMTKDYEVASNYLKEVDRALSTSDKAMRDTTMRKLASTSRENFAFRKDLLSELERLTGKDLSSAISGAAMDSWMPKGLVAKLGGGGLLTGGVASAMSHPLSAAGAFGASLLASPRVVGEGLSTIADIKRGYNSGINKIGADNISLLRNLAIQAGRNRNLQVDPRFQGEEE